MLLFITHILGSITVGIIFRFWKKNLATRQQYTISKYDNKLQNITVSNLGEILGTSIQSAISTILMIGGFVVLFSVVISILNISGITSLVCILLEPVCHFLGISSQIIASVFTGLFEVTNGINMVSLIKLKNISLNIIVTAILLGFGGLSVLLQVFSIVSKSDLSIKPYVIGKILHGVFAGFYTFLIISIFPIFNFNL
ncbi:MAG: nucleoside recognition domain-containing protein [Clostridia bacterium]|jgi:sporulation integral membrane protein ylbJ